MIVFLEKSWKQQVTAIFIGLILCLTHSPLQSDKTIYRVLASWNKHRALSVERSSLKLNTFTNTPNWKCLTRRNCWKTKVEDLLGSIVKPLYPNISMHIYHTVLHIFSKVLLSRIWITIKTFFSWWSFPLFLWPYCVIQGWYYKEKLHARHY